MQRCIATVGPISNNEILIVAGSSDDDRVDDAVILNIETMESKRVKKPLGIRARNMSEGDMRMIS